MPDNDINIDTIIKKMYQDYDKKVKAITRIQTRHKLLTFSQIKEICLFPNKYLKEHIERGDQRTFVYPFLYKVFYNHKLVAKLKKLNKKYLKLGFRNKSEWLRSKRR